MEQGLPLSRPLPWSCRRAQEGWHHLAQSSNEFFFSNWGGFPVDLKHFTPSLWKLGLGKEASPSSPHHPQGLEDSWTSHSVSQPVWA